jgi:glycosyltransferase involved in cell wall biosynthesis
MLPRIDLNNINYIPTISQLFNSRQLFISEANLSLEYIHFIRPINETEEEKYKQELYPGLSPDLSFTENRNDQIDLYTFYKMCSDEQLLSYEPIKFSDKPLISVLIPSYNKQDILLKSIRSIQNQSFKNLEIIIVNDGSTDNSSAILDYLLKTDPRVRVFHHLKNLGAWRSRLDGFLYSKAPFVIHFDTGDFYTDNLVLEDAYTLITQYNLDSIRFSFKLSRKKEDLDYKSWNFSFSKKDRKIVYGRREYNMLLYAYGPIWNRLTRANIFTKGLDYLDEYILNAYKNLYEDRWWNTFANNASYSYLMVNRVGYIYLRIPGGAGIIMVGDEKTNEKTLKEFIYFWLFDYLLLYKGNNKKSVIKQLYKHNNITEKIKLTSLKHYFPPYIHLLDLLINDTYVEDEDREFVKQIKFNYTKRIENQTNND